MGFLDAIIPRKLRSTIVLGALVIVAQMVCEKLEAPSWVGFVVAAVLGGLYHSVFMQVDMIGTKAAPLVELDYIQGEGLKLNGGNPTIVVIFSTRGLARAFTHLEKLYKAWHPKGAQIIAISREPKARVADWVKKQGLSYPVAVDSSIDAGATYTKYPVARVPTAFLCRGDGVIGWQGHPLDSALEATLEKATTAAIASAAAKKKAAAAPPPRSSKKEKSLRHRR